MPPPQWRTGWRNVPYPPSRVIAASARRPARVVAYRYRVITLICNGTFAPASASWKERQRSAVAGRSFSEFFINQYNQL